MTNCKLFKSLAVSVLLLSALMNVTTASAETDKSKNLVFLCFGQSNMEGNATPESQDNSGVNTRFKKMYAADSWGSSNLGKWTTAKPPLCRKSTGLTPVDYFGRYLIDSLSTEYQIRVIVVAVAGCSIKMFDKDQYKSYIASLGSDSQWMKNIADDYGGNPYQRLIDMAKIAQETGEIKGILLHQGETDAYNDQWITTATKIYEDILSDLGGLKKADVPILVGEVVNADQNGACSGANSTLSRFCSKQFTAYLISSAGCPAGSDNLHFNAEGYRMLGKRYGEKMYSLLKRKGYKTRSQQQAEKAPVLPVMEDAPGIEIYDLNGMRLDAPGPGLNIMDGRKVLIAE